MTNKLKKQFFINYWWVDLFFYNIKNVKFNYINKNDKDILLSNNSHLFIYTLTLKYNFYLLKFFLYDLSFLNNNFYYIFETYFFNIKLTFKYKKNSKVNMSISNIFNSAVWSERELKELNNITLTGLKDTRKLLNNYNNNSIQYNNYNNINYDYNIKLAIKLH